MFCMCLFGKVAVNLQDWKNGGAVMSTWLKDCEICNAGLCSAVDDRKETGMSEKKIFQEMSEESEGIYSPGAIRQRYKYYKNHGSEKVSPPGKSSEKNRRPRSTTRKSFMTAFEKCHAELFKAKNGGWKAVQKETALKKIYVLLRMVKRSSDLHAVDVLEKGESPMATRAEMPFKNEEQVQSELFLDQGGRVN